jgi:hypothetical protein
MEFQLEHWGIVWHFQVSAFCLLVIGLWLGSAAVWQNFENEGLVWDLARDLVQTRGVCLHQQLGDYSPAPSVWDFLFLDGPTVTKVVIILGLAGRLLGL